MGDSDKKDRGIDGQPGEDSNPDKEPSSEKRRRIEALKDIVAEQYARGKASEEGDKAAPKREGKGEKEAFSPLMPEVAALSDDELKGLLLEIKKGILGNAERKLKKDIKKKLGVSDDEVFDRGTLLAYSRLKGAQKKLKSMLLKKHKEELKKAKASDKAQEAEEKAAEKEPAETSEEKSGEKKSEQFKKPSVGTEMKGSFRIKDPEPRKKEPTFKIVDKRTSKVEKPDMKVPKTFSPHISERARRIEAILEEQHRMEKAEKEKKLKKKSEGNAITRPIKAFRGGVGNTFGKVSHAFFVFFTTILSIPISLGKILAKGTGGFLQGIYKRVGRFSPFGWKKKINMLIIYSGIDKTQIEVTGITIVNGAVLATIISAVGYFLLNWNIFIVLIAALFSFAIVWVVVYSVINLMADKRSDEVEGALPDVLQIVSSNISAGMTPYNALWVSARKEFGALAEEIKIAQKETLGGKPFADSLTDMANRVRSNVLQRTIRLLIQGMKAGGELPRILQGIGTDIRQMRLLQKEMAANTMSYILFILFGMILGAPLLFSVSIQFVDIMNKFQPEEIDLDMQELQSTPVMGGGMGSGFDVMSLGGGGCPKDFDGDGIPDEQEREMGLNSKNSSDASSLNPETGKTYLQDYQEVAEPLPPACITPGYLSMFATLSLLSVGFFGSILIGLIRDGKQSAGLKLAPVLIPATLGMFWLMSNGMSFFFNSMFG